MKRVLLVYFSGTGCTEKVTLELRNWIRSEGYETLMYSLDISDLERLATYLNVLGEELHHMVLLYPVYAGDAPQPVYAWLDTIPEHRIPTSVISVSGAGEMWPNTASRVYTIKALEKKGYHVIYEDMIVMPSNFIYETNPALCKLELEALPSKLERIAKEALSGTIKRIKKPRTAGFLHALANIEKRRAVRWGQRLKINTRCTHCSWCIEHCPTGNIQKTDSRVVFLNQCTMCLRCVYGCPVHAIEPGRYKSFILKDGFNLRKIENIELDKEQSMEECAKGYKWKGVKKYLES